MYILFFFAIQCLAIVPLPWYNCLDPGGQTGASYSSGDIERAIQEAFRRAQDSEFAQSSHNNLYPRRYYYVVQNWAGVGINTRVNVNNLIEFPLVQGGVFTNGSPAGQDRVIIDASAGTFAGVLTHRGVGAGNFRPCIGAQQPTIPDVAPYNPPFGSNNPLLFGFPFGPEAGGSGGYKKEKLKVRAVEMRA